MAPRRINAIALRAPGTVAEVAVALERSCGAAPLLATGCDKRTRKLGDSSVACQRDQRKRAGDALHPYASCTVSQRQSGMKKRRREKRGGRGGRRESASAMMVVGADRYTRRDTHQGRAVEIGRESGKEGERGRERERLRERGGEVERG